MINNESALKARITKNYEDAGHVQEKLIQHINLLCLQYMIKKLIFINESSKERNLM